MVTYTLVPRDSFHVGESMGRERTRVLTHIPSDTLFAAIVTAWARLGQVTTWLPHITGAQPPPFELTSAFPCLIDEENHPILRFYPYPLVKLNVPQKQIKATGKKLLKVVWVSERLFERLCRGEDVSDACADPYFAPGHLWVDPDDLDKLPRDKDGKLIHLWTGEKDRTVPRVTLDRVTGASQVYHVGRVTLASHVGLWFAMHSTDILVDAVDTALNFLADAGLGGLRSIGYGAFEYLKVESDLPAISDKGEYAVALARYVPRNIEEAIATLKAPHTAYKLTRVGGWCVDDHQHAWVRRKVMMVTEGSILRQATEGIGDLKDVSPEKPKDWHEDITAWPFGSKRAVYRWGYAFTMPIASKALPQEVSDA